MKQKFKSLFLVLCMVLTLVPVAVFAEGESGTSQTTYTITYDANGGSGSMVESTVVQGQALTLPDKASGFTAPSGKHFRGWAIGDANGTIVNPGKSYTFTGDTEVYAVWGYKIKHIREYKEDMYNYEVVTDPNGKLPYLETNYNYLDGYTSEAGLYSAEGWYTEPVGGTEVTKDTVFTQDMSIYVRWVYDESYGSKFTADILVGGESAPATFRVITDSVGEEPGEVQLGTGFFFEYAIPREATGTIVIPSTVEDSATQKTYKVTRIAGNAFSYHRGLTGIIFEAGSNIKKVGKSAFNYVPIVGHLEIPSTVETIEQGAFCAIGITSLSFADNSSLKTIGTSAFYALPIKGTITFPASLTEIGYEAFAYNWRLEGLIFQEGSQLQKIGKTAFYDCRSLKGNLMIPDGVTSIGPDAFTNVKGLTSVMFLANEAPSLEKNSDGRFPFDKSIPIYFPDGGVNYEGESWSYYTVREGISSKTRPSAPTNVVAAGNGQLIITWDEPDDDGGSPITGYEVSIDNGTNWISTGSANTSYTVTGLINNTSYYVKVRGVNAIDPGVASEQIIGKPEILAVAPVITTDTLPDGTVGTTYSQTLTATGDTPITWSLETGNSLPAGLTLASTGVISGTPTASETVTFTVKAANGVDPAATKELSITIAARQNSGGGHTGGSSSDGSSVGSWTVDTGNTANMPTLASLTLTDKPNQNGNLTMNITKKMVEDGIGEAERKWSGRESYGASIAFNNTSAGAESLTTSIEAAALDNLVSQGVKSMSLQSGIYRITLDEKVIKSLDNQSTGNVTVTVAPYKVSGTAATVIGSRPVFEITFKDSKGTEISNFGSGTITRGIKYTAASGEDSGSLFIVKVTSSGVEWITNSRYENGWVIWNGNSNSVYGVGYKTAVVFIDTQNHWAKDNIDYVVSRELLSGVSSTTFAPNTAITRADFLMALGKLSGVDVSGYKTSSFIDVVNDSTAMTYIEWAYKNGIVSGTGNNQFSPNAAITREQMAVMMQNYAKVAGFTMPVSRQYNAFTDDSKISSWSKDAVKAIAQAGIIIGKEDGKFDPQGNATRAEAATILHRFVELVID